MLASKLTLNISIPERSFPELFSFAKNKKISVAMARATRPLSLAPL